MIDGRVNRTATSSIIITTSTITVHSSETMKTIAAGSEGRELMLYVLLGATGLRFGEAFGLEIDKHISDDFSTLHIRQKVWSGRVAVGPKILLASASTNNLLMCNLSDGSRLRRLATSVEATPSDILERALQLSLRMLIAVASYCWRRKPGQCDAYARRFLLLFLCRNCLYALSDKSHN
jgi:hypothetical protein